LAWLGKNLLRETTLPIVRFNFEIQRWHWTRFPSSPRTRRIPKSFPILAPIYTTILTRVAVDG
jgi:hypothetical protein